MSILNDEDTKLYPGSDRRNFGEDWSWGLPPLVEGNASYEENVWQCIGKNIKL
jgi:hypothetical protein